MNVDGHSTVITPALPYIFSFKSKIGEAKTVTMEEDTDASDLWYTL